MPKQHYFDQKGEVIYAVGDPNATCEGCVYQWRKLKEKKDCNTIVPVEHMRGASHTHGMYCVEQMKKYKKLNR